MNFSSAQEIVLHLKQKKLSILLGGFLAVIFYVSFLFLYPKSFESNAVIYNSNKNKIGATHLSPDNTLQDLSESYTIINWVYSTQLIDHLITKFDLYKHYGISQTEPDFYSKCFNEISQGINVHLTSYGAVQISVQDQDRFLAAAITNEILNQIDKLNKEKVVENRKYIIHEYEFLLKEFSSDVNSQRDTVKRMISSLSQISKGANAKSQKADEVMNSLSTASKNYEKLSSEWLALRKVHLLSLKELEKFNLPNFVIVQYALPELLKPTFSLANGAFVFLLFIFGSWLAIVILLLRFRYTDHVKLLFSEPSELTGQEAPKVYPLKTETNKLESENLKSIPNKN